MNQYKPPTIANEPPESAQDKVARLETDYARLQREISHMKVETQQLLQRYNDLEEQATSLTSLYVSCHRLHARLDRNEVLETVQEIIINLIGCEEYAVLELPKNHRELMLLNSSGIDPEQYRHVELGRGPIGRAAASGEIFLAGKHDAGPTASGNDNITACIPLKLKGQVTGVIALFRLLPHKGTLGEFDRELFDVLQVHVPPALAYTEPLAEGTQMQERA